MPPSQEQLSAISITERVCSIISLVGASVIITTFVGSRSFRKPINRLVFYACWGNVMTNIATLISQSGIRAGVGSPLCQAQAFLIQWFMPADALWTFAMACNVYLTFFHKYNSAQLRQLEWKYLIGCYGIPFIPAFIFFFIHTPARGRVYGSAILWCWIAIPWDLLRVVLFYGPVWFVIFLTFAIYFRAGAVIYQKRRELKSLGGLDSLDTDTTTNFPLVNPAGIQVTSEIAYSAPQHPAPAAAPAARGGDGLQLVPTHSSTSSNFAPYSVTIEGGMMDPINMYQNSEEPLPPMRGSIPNVDPSVDRSERSMSLRTCRSAGTGRYSQRRGSAIENTSAAWAYTKYAMLFFIALLVTWVPSTVNRVYALARQDEFSYGSNYASSFVLPLQGFWNSLIYTSISWPAFKTFGRDVRLRIQELQKIT